MSRFELELDRERYEPGDAIRGTILVVEGGRARSLDVLLQYKEETRDYSDVASSVTSRVNVGDLTKGVSFEFELVLPPDAFPNYLSENGVLYWELEVRSDEPDRDTHVRRRIQVGHDDPERAFDLGVSCLEHDDSTWAEAAFRCADAGGLVKGSLNLGVLLEQRGDADEAEAAYRRADERGDAEGSFGLGMLRADCGDLEGAAAAWRRAAATDDEEMAEKATDALDSIDRPEA